jgi:Cysteine-rich secretory protein family
MVMPNRRFRKIVNHGALILATISLVGTAQAAKRKRSVNAAPVPVIVDHFQAEMLRAHNDERKFHGRAPLAWDAALAADAAKWAGTLAAKNQFQHAFAELTKKKQGENLWMGTRGSYRFDEMVAHWTDEVKQTRSGRFPDVSKTGNWADVGHFTQLVWPSTTKVGCAIRSSVQDDYLVCRYWPAGNMIGENFTIRSRK